MIDDDRHADGCELDTQCVPRSRAAGYQHAPALPAFHPVGGSLQTLFRTGGIGDSLITETQPDAAHPTAVHVVERCLRGLVVDHRDSPRAAAELADAVDHARVVRSVCRRLHDDHTVETECLHHLLKLGHHCGLRRVAASFPVGMTLRIAVDVHRAVCCTRRYIEAHLRVRL